MSRSIVGQRYRISGWCIAVVESCNSKHHLMSFHFTAGRKDTRCADASGADAEPGEAAACDKPSWQREGKSLRTVDRS